MSDSKEPDSKVSESKESDSKLPSEESISLQDLLETGRAELDSEHESEHADLEQSELNTSMLKSDISNSWQPEQLPCLMTLTMDVVESLYGLEARDQAEVALFELETELAAELNDVDGPVSGQALVTALYGPLGFAGDWERFFAVDNCLMDRVIGRRRGIPVSMAVLLLYLCARFDIRAEGIGFPGHFLVRIFDASFEDDGNSSQIVDPFTGEQLSHHQIEQLLRGARGNLAKLTPQHLVAAEPLAVIMRLLNVTKASFIHHQHFTHALMCSQLLLTLTPDCPHERRDRGFLYEQLECHQLAAEDFEYFIEQCPEDPLADILKIQVMALDLLPHVVH